MKINKNENIETLDEDNKDSINSTFYNSENSSLNNSNLIVKNHNNMNDNYNGEKLEILEIEKQDNNTILYDDKVFGNDIKIKKPYRYGKTFTCLYYKNHPIIVIGPDCKEYI